jgi:hypothetical protein
MAMTLFDEFKQQIPSNEALCHTAATTMLKGVDAKTIKTNFSSYIDKLNSQVYREYLDAQARTGQAILQNRVRRDLSGLYSELDSFYMSIFQSRKSRAGSAFEFIIKELFIRLDYPFSEQVNVEGAKPDFVLPSEAYFRERPLDSIIFTAKRTLRERWRQVVTEADKGYGFFLKSALKHYIFV